MTTTTPTTTANKNHRLETVVSTPNTIRSIKNTAVLAKAVVNENDNNSNPRRKNTNAAAAAAAATKRAKIMTTHPLKTTTMTVSSLDLDGKSEKKKKDESVNDARRITTMILA